MTNKLSFTKHFASKLFAVALGLLVFLNSCNNDDNTEEPTFKSASEFDSEVIISWYDLIKTLTTETQGYTPPVAARAFGYTGIALYEAVQKGIPEKASLSGKLTDLDINISYDETKEYHWPTVANNVLAEMTKYFYTNTSIDRFNRILALQDQFNTTFSAANSLEVHDRSVLLAKNTADKIISWSTSDGGFNAQFNNFPSDYTPPQGEEFWKPTFPDFTPALQPYWGSNRPFIQANVVNSIPVDPPVFSKEETSIFYIRAKEVYDVVNNIKPEEKVIAEFWSDDPVTTATPPGHSISVLNQLIKSNNTNLAVSAESFAKLGIGISDAFVSCWKVKYTTNYLRPITYIREYIDPEWNTILGTPPFPEYTSGHSVQSGALAEIMTSFFGENYQFTDNTHANRTDIDGTPRSYDSFYKMAEEAAISRLYGGIHYQEAIFLGLEQGYQIGKNVNNLDLNVATQ